MFRRTAKPKLFAVVDLGSMLKAVVLEKGAHQPLPLVRKKKAIPLLQSGGARRWGAILREVLFEILREFEQVPEHIAVGLGSEVGPTSVAEWRAKPTGSGIRSSKELISFFKNLLDEHRDINEAMIAHPVGIKINGYPIDLGRDSEKLWEKPLRGEITFVTLLLRVPAEAGTALAEAKASLGGLPVELIPRLAAEAEALTGVLGVEEGLLVEIGAQTSSILRLDQGMPLHVASFPYELKVGKTAEWKQGFLRTLDEFYHLGPLSSAVFLVGEGAAVPELRETLKDQDWLKNYSHLESPRVQAIQGTRLFEGNSLDGNIGGWEDFGLASLVYYTLHHNPLF